jgi:hypothetical protein
MDEMDEMDAQVVLLNAHHFSLSRSQWLVTLQVYHTLGLCAAQLSCSTRTTVSVRTDCTYSLLHLLLLQGGDILRVKRSASAAELHIDEVISCCSCLSCVHAILYHTLAKASAASMLSGAYSQQQAVAMRLHSGMSLPSGRYAISDVTGATVTISDVTDPAAQCLALQLSKRMHVLVCCHSFATGRRRQ